MLHSTEGDLPFDSNLFLIRFACRFQQSDNRTVTSMADLQDHPDWVVRTYKPSRSYAVPGTVP